MEVLLIVLLIVVVGGVAIASVVWNSRRSQDLLETWAAEHDYQIIDQESRSFRLGPFFWSTSKSQSVYYVTVRDQHGRLRSGWVRCGSFWGGLFSDKTEVSWE